MLVFLTKGWISICDTLGSDSAREAKLVMTDLGFLAEPEDDDAEMSESNGNSENPEEMDVDEYNESSNDQGGRNEDGPPDHSKESLLDLPELSTESYDEDPEVSYA